MTLLAEQMNTVTVSKFRLSLEKMKISFTRGLSRMFSIFLDRSLINQTALLRARIVVFSRLHKKKLCDSKDCSHGYNHDYICEVPAVECF